jgi:hypothetical protein
VRRREATASRDRSTYRDSIGRPGDTRRGTRQGARLGAIPRLHAPPAKEQGFLDSHNLERIIFPEPFARALPNARDAAELSSWANPGVLRDFRVDAMAPVIKVAVKGLVKDTNK